MDNDEFAKIRKWLGKTQLQLANLLGISLKAVKSFEQGWRNIPVHTERQILFLAAAKAAQKRSAHICWEMKHCPMERRQRCPAWELASGQLCWFINGTICHGQVQKDWPAKMKLCRQCPVFKSFFSALLS